MMRLGFLSDVHADVHALQDALAQLDRLRVNQVICCGDLIDYGLFPEQTLALLIEKKVTCIRGNHDRWAVESGWDSTGWDLTERSFGFLEQLKPTWRATVEGIKIVAWHARPFDDMHGIDADTSDAELEELLGAADANVLVVGHKHVPFVRKVGAGKMVINPGALLRDPADGVEVLTPGTFAVVTVNQGQVEVVHGQVQGRPLSGDTAR